MIRDRSGTVVEGRALAAAGLVALALVSSCGRGRSDPDKERLLADLGAVVILPGYRQFAEETRSLRGAAETFSSAPSPASLGALQEAWKKARRAWNLCQAHFIGPEAGRLLHAKIATFPVATSKIEGVIAGSDPIDEGFVERLGGNRKGFLAIESLLFDSKGGAGALSAMSTAPQADRRRALLVALAQNLEKVARQIRDHWEPDRGNFLQSFSRAGHPGSTYASQDAAIDDLINHLVSFAELTADMRLGRPLGAIARKPNAPDPALVEAGASGQSVEEIRALLEGMKNVYEGCFAGKRGVGLCARAARVSPEIDLAIRTGLDQAITDVAAIPESLEAAVKRHPDSVRKAFGSVKQVQMRFAVDLVAVYKTTLRVIAFDGD